MAMSTAAASDASPTASTAWHQRFVAAWAAVDAAERRRGTGGDASKSQAAAILSPTNATAGGSPTATPSPATAEAKARPPLAAAAGGVDTKAPADGEGNGDAKRSAGDGNGAAAPAAAAASAAATVVMASVKLSAPTLAVAAAYAGVWRVAEEMAAVATETARAIIADIPTHAAIPPADSSRRRFITRGLLFEIASDDRSGDSFRYGGAAANDEYASKAAAHEHKATARFFAASRDLSHSGARIHVPMSILVEWRGFRVRVTPVVTNASSVVVYGVTSAAPAAAAAAPNGSSTSGGAATTRIVNNDSGFATDAQRCSNRMHLRGHRVRWAPGTEQITEFYGPADMRGYVIDGGAFYAENIARVFPPEHSLMTRHLAQPEQSVFFRLLRPELLDAFFANAGKILNPDALTTFSHEDPEFATHCEDVAAATRYLLADVVPKLGESLHDVLWQARVSAGAAASMTDVQLACSRALTNEMHSRGVNMRHLGALYGTVPASSDVRQTLLIEMTQRTLKQLMRDRLRRSYHPMAITTITGASQGPSPYRATVGVPRMVVKKIGPAAAAAATTAATTPVVLPLAAAIEMLNRICSGEQAFWNWVREQLHLRFGAIGLAGRGETKAEYAGVDLFNAVRPALLHIVPYVLNTSGLRMSSTCQAAFLRQSSAALSAAHSASEAFVFSTGDIVESDVRTRMCAPLEAARGHAMVEHARQAMKHTAAAVTAARLDAAAEALRAGLSGTPSPDSDSIRHAALIAARAKDARRDYAAADDILLRHAETTGDDAAIDDVLTLWAGRRAKGGIAGRLHLAGAASADSIARLYEWDYGDDRRLREVRGMRHAAIRSFVTAVHDRTSDPAIEPLLRHVDTCGLEEFAFGIGLNNARNRVAHDPLCQPALWALFKPALAAGDWCLISVLHELGLDIDRRVAGDRTMVMEACMRKDAPLLSCLLDLGAHVNLRDATGETALLQLVTRLCEQPTAAIAPNDMALLMKLRDGGADADLADADDETPLHHAAHHGALAAVTQLLVFRPDLQRRNRRGDNALAVAALRGHVPVVRRLLSAGAPMLFNEKTLWTRVIDAKQLEVLKALWSFSGGAVMQSDDLRSAVRSQDLALVRMMMTWHAQRYAQSTPVVTVQVLDLSISGRYTAVTDGILADVAVRKENACIFFAALLAALRMRDIPLISRLYQLLCDADKQSDGGAAAVCVLHGQGCVPLVVDDGPKGTGRWATRDHEAVRVAMDIGIPLGDMFAVDIRELIVEAGRHGDVSFLKDLAKKRGVNLEEWLDKIALEWSTAKGNSPYPPWVVDRDLMAIARAIFAADVPAQDALDRLEGELGPNTFKWIAEASVPFIDHAEGKRGAAGDGKDTPDSSDITASEAVAFMLGLYYEDVEQWAAIPRERIIALAAVPLSAMLSRADQRALGDSVADALWLHDGDVALTFAVGTGRLVIAAALLNLCGKSVLDIVAPGNGRTPLMCVMDAAGARLLLDAGAGVNTVSDNHETALTCAKAAGKQDVVDMLMESKADPNLGGPPPDPSGSAKRKARFAKNPVDDGDAQGSSPNGGNIRRGPRGGTFGSGRRSATAANGRRGSGNAGGGRDEPRGARPGPSSTFGSGRRTERRRPPGAVGSAAAAQGRATPMTGLPTPAYVRAGPKSTFGGGKSRVTQRRASDSGSESGSDGEARGSPRRPRSAPGATSDRSAADRRAVASPRISALAMSRGHGNAPLSSITTAALPGSGPASLLGGVAAGGPVGKVPWYPIGYGKPENADPWPSPREGGAPGAPAAGPCSTCGQTPCSCGSSRDRTPESPSPKTPQRDGGARVHFAPSMMS